jgi:hypothetical protein
MEQTLFLQQASAMVCALVDMNAHLIDRLSTNEPGRGCVSTAVRFVHFAAVLLRDRPFVC